MPNGQIMGPFTRMDTVTRFHRPVYEGFGTGYLYYYEEPGIYGWLFNKEYTTKQAVVYHSGQEQQPHLVQPGEWKEVVVKGQGMVTNPAIKVCCNDGTCAAR